MKKYRRIVWIALFIVLILCTFITIRYIRSINEKIPDKTFILPKLDSAIVEITELTYEKTKLNSHLLLNNPLPFKISADSIAYEFFISDSSVMKSSYRESISLKASDTTWIFVPVTVYNQELISILKRSEKYGFDSVYYEVKASFYSHLLKERKFDFHFGRMLPLLHIPEIKIGKVEVDSLNLKRMVLLVHANILNENIFPIRAKNISYRMGVAGHKWITGFMPGELDIKDTSTTPVIFPVRISLEEVGETVFTLLKKGKKVPYDFEMEMTTASKQHLMNNSRIIITNGGTIEQVLELRRAAGKKKRDK